VVEFQNVSYAYDGELVLKDVSFRLKEGTCLFLQGPNGAGKSTLLKIINALCFPTTGQYFFQGNKIDRDCMKDNKFSKGFHQKIGYVWQNPDAQLFCGSVEDEIAFGPRQMGLTDDEIKKRVDDALNIFDLTRLRHRAPYSLSGGEKKKTAIAAVFVMNPILWTLDEPLDSLDLKSKDRLSEFLLGLKKAGKTILFSSHDRDLAKQIADSELYLSENHEILVPASL